MTNCSCRFSCTGIALVLSAVVGVVTALLTVTGTVTVAPVFLIVATSIAAGFVAVTYIAALFKDSTCCLCKCTTIKTLLFGAIGTLLAGILLLSVTFPATSILGAVITGFLLAFLTLIFAESTCYATCCCNE